jgi:hypothetical protein
MNDPEYYVTSIASGMKFSYRILLHLSNISPGNPNRRGRISSVDLPELTKSDQLFFLLKAFFLFFKTFYFKEEVNCTEPSPSVRVPFSILSEMCLNKLELCGWGGFRVIMQSIRGL